MDLEGRMSSCPSNRDDLKETTVEELEQEHLWRIYEVWEQALQDLEDEPNRHEIILMLLKGWTDEQHIMDSEITLGNKVFFNDWEITRTDDGWSFENCCRENCVFLDTDLLIGLERCEQIDREPSAQRESLIHKFRLNESQIIQLDRYTRTVAAATKVRAERQMIAEASL